MIAKSVQVENAPAENTLDRADVESRTTSEDVASAVRRWGLVMLIGTIGFAVYGSLTPFNFRFPAGTSTWQHLGNIPARMTEEAGRVDFFSNVSLFVPIGLGGMAWLTRKQWSLLNLLFLPAVILFALGVSLFCESAQTLLPSRVASWYDVLAHALGVSLGATAWLVCGPWIRNWLEEVYRNPQDHHSFDLFLKGYFVFQSVMSLFPLDVTIHPADLFQKFRQGQINPVPFLGHEWTSELVLEMLFFGFTCIPFGALATRLGMPWRTVRNVPDSLTLGAIMIVGIELCQLFVFSRFTDATQIVIGSVGMAIGVAGMHLAWPQESAGEVRSGWSAHAGVWWVAGLVYTLFPAFFLLWPFDFVIDSVAIKQELHGMSQLPLVSLLRSSPLQMSTILLRDALLYFPLGLLLAAGIHRVRTPWKLPTTILAVLLIVGSVVGIEILQTVVPGRVADVTTILVGCTAALCGLVSLSIAEDFLTSKTR